MPPAQRIAGEKPILSMLGPTCSPSRKPRTPITPVALRKAASAKLPTATIISPALPTILRPAGANPIYYVEDLLGTSRVTTTNTGSVCYDADYYPYGGERPYTNTCTQ